VWGGWGVWANKTFHKKKRKLMGGGKQEEVINLLLFGDELSLKSPGQGLGKGEGKGGWEKARC